MVFNMFQKIYDLKMMRKYVPDLVLDIGAHHGNWTHILLSIFEDADFHLFEAIDYAELGRYDENERVKVHKLLLGDEDGKKVKWYQQKNTGDSIFREKTFHFEDCEVIEREMTTLNKVCEKIDLTKYSEIFIKIDCQGAEIPILKGATKLLSKSSFILLEIPLFGVYNEGVPSFLAHIQFMDSIGYVPFDIFECHYINGFHMQTDMMFIKKDHPLNQIVNQELLIRR